MKEHRDYTYTLMALAILLQGGLSPLISFMILVGASAPNMPTWYTGLPIVLAPAYWVWKIGKWRTLRLPPEQQWLFWRYVPPAAIAASFLTLLFALAK